MNTLPTEEIKTTGGCPVDHQALSRQKLHRPFQQPGPVIEKDGQGVWQIRGFEAARAILRSNDTKQAGFKAELIQKLPRMGNMPVLYQDGKPHNEQRKQIARFFTPKAVSANYRYLMDKISDEIIHELGAKKQVDLSQLTLKMAVQVAGEVVGLTSSVLPGMDKRLENFFEKPVSDFKWNLPTVWKMVFTQLNSLAFFLFDVWPAIRARRKAPREDVISYLIERDYKNLEILTECVTYGAAGMVTTREFISAATWHFIENPALRERYLNASEEERHDMLEESLRVESIVGNLYRRATADITLESNGQSYTIRQGELINLHVYEANADPQVVGEDPEAICPARSFNAKQVTPALLGFGDGAHRCPGSYIAIQETDILLNKLLRLPGLRIVQTPQVKWNDLTTGYEVRNFIIAVD